MSPAGLHMQSSNNDCEHMSSPCESVNRGPSDSTSDGPSLDLELTRTKLYGLVSGWAADLVDALIAEVEKLRQEKAQAIADIIRMAQTKVGDKCEHHKLPLAQLEYTALRECPLCWMSAAKEAEAELARLRASATSMKTRV